MNWSKRSCLVLALAAGAWQIALAVGPSPLVAADAQAGPASPAARAADIPWLFAQEEAPWTLALAAPVAAQLQQSGPSPILMAATNPLTREAEGLLALSPPASGRPAADGAPVRGSRPIVLATSDRMKLGAVLARRSPLVLKIGGDPCAASVAVAKHFWASTHSVVVAAADDPEAAILGSALAAALRVPLLLCERDQPGDGVEAVLKDLSVARVLVAVSNAKNRPRWIDRLEVPCEIMSPRMLQHRLAVALGRDKIRNVVVARAPDERAEVGRSAWLAPYISLARGAAVVLVRASAAAVAESDVRQLIERESLSVQTVTILADYTSIGYRNVEVDPNGSEDWPNAAPPATNPPAPAAAIAAQPAPPPHYTVRTEPFIPTQPDQLSTVGVGRLPLESLADTSVMFARGLLRERLLANREPRVLMVANAGVFRKLVLCETISRVTASEFKNLGVHVDEFYGRSAVSPEILNAARTANLILYEGHLSSQDLIDNPEIHRSSPPEYADDEDEDPMPGESPDGAASRPAPAPRVVPAEPLSRHLQGPLSGLPIVFLQSCESADDGILWRLDELGGVALIGSMTSIHSGAGSAMLNAAMSSALYRGGTLGEVLRDAQNYMLCIEELKGRRGHKEQAKGVRVALSFRLWGDPELRLLPMPLAAPRLAAVRAAWQGWDRLRIDVPAARLPEAQADKYTAFPFPNSQFAGLLRTESGETKRLLPVYFFCLPLPANGALALEPSRVDSRRMDVRIDRGRGVAYVVYLPDQEHPGDSIVLRLRQAPPAEQIGRSSP
jgi:hypothetical protein